jgi:hypothetical protein
VRAVAPSSRLALAGESLASPRRARIALRISFESPLAYDFFFGFITFYRPVLKPVSPGIYVPTAALDGQLLNIWRPLHADENLQTGKIRGYEALSLRIGAHFSAFLHEKKGCRENNTSLKSFKPRASRLRISG